MQSPVTINVVYLVPCLMTCERRARGLIADKLYEQVALHARASVGLINKAQQRGGANFRGVKT